MGNIRLTFTPTATSVGVKILRDGVQIHDLTPVTPGVSTTWDDNSATEDVLVTYKVRPYNSGNIINTNDTVGNTESITPVAPPVGGVDILDLINAASETEVVNGINQTEVWTGVTFAVNSVEHLAGTQSIKMASTGAGGLGFLVINGMEIGATYQLKINYKSNVPSATARTINQYYGHVSPFEATLTETPSQWREITFPGLVSSNVWDTFKVALNGGDSGSDLFIDKISCIKTGQMVDTGANLFPANDAAGSSDTNVVSANWSSLYGTVTVDTSDPHSGTRCIKFNKTVATSPDQVAFTFPATANKYYRVSFWMKVKNAVGVDSINLIPYNKPTIANTAWTKIDAVVKAASTGDFQTLMLVYGASTTAEILFDDIDVRELV